MRRIRPHELRALCVGSQPSRAGRRTPADTSQLQYGTPRLPNDSTGCLHRWRRAAKPLHRSSEPCSSCSAHGARGSCAPTDCMYDVEWHLPRRAQVDVLRSRYPPGVTRECDKATRHGRSRLTAPRSRREPKRRKRLFACTWRLKPIKSILKRFKKGAQAPLIYKRRQQCRILFRVNAYSPRACSAFEPEKTHHACSLSLSLARRGGHIACVLSLSPFHMRRFVAARGMEVEVRGGAAGRRAHARQTGVGAAVESAGTPSLSGL